MRSPKRVPSVPPPRANVLGSSACELLGYSEPELLRQTVQELTHPEDLDAQVTWCPPTL